MYRICLIIFFLAGCNVAMAQHQLSGVVLDAKSRQALSGASVFINGASKGTVTDKDGYFILNDISFNSFELIVSYVSYETIIIKISPDNINKRFRIEMEVKQNQLQEVVVGPVEKDGWKIWGKVFTDNFIGTSNNAKACVIKNPGVLRFRYNKKSQVLTVSGIDKLVISNNALGYDINYQLEEFVYDRKNSIVTYLGYSSFQPRQQARKRKLEQWEESRREAYNGSIMHFFRSFYRNSLEEEGYTLTSLSRLYRNDSTTIEPYNRIINGNYSDVDTALFSIQFIKSNSVFNSAPVIHIIGKKPLEIASVRLVDTTRNLVFASFNNSIQFTYKKELERKEYWEQFGGMRKTRGPQTSIIYLTNNRPIAIEKNGLYFEPLDLFTEGYLAWEKLGEMLPSDYGLTP